MHPQSTPNPSLSPAVVEAISSTLAEQRLTAEIPDLSRAGVDRIIAALAAAGVEVHYTETDGDTFLDVWLTDVESTTGPAVILSWRDNGEGWLLRQWEDFEGDTNAQTPDRKWPIATGSLAEVARDVAACLAEPEEKPEPESGHATMPGPSYFKAVDELQESIGELMSRCVDDPRGYVALVAAKSGALAYEQRKLQTLAGQRGETPTDPRRAIYEIVTAAVAKGLPLPANIQIPGHYDLATIQLPQNDKAGVDAWVSYLNLPAPRLDEPLSGTGNRCYSVDLAELPQVPDWHITIQCFCTEAGA